jgi:16S rRNA A1518/A1519 N6-dimethyltransferase RsmA/KsgA/DIM1 with predicted DNA glycosylase/AP lyase activity
MPFVFLHIISMELKKSLGQHFLHDENMLKKIAQLWATLQTMPL